MKVKVAQSCPTLCDPMDCSPPGFSVHGIFQARILEGGAIPFSRGIFLTQGSNLGLLHCSRFFTASTTCLYFEERKKTSVSTPDGFFPSWWGFFGSQRGCSFCACNSFKNFHWEQQVDFHSVSVHCVFPSLWGWRRALQRTLACRNGPLRAFEVAGSLQT